MLYHNRTQPNRSSQHLQPAQANNVNKIYVERISKRSELQQVSWVSMISMLRKIMAKEVIILIPARLESSRFPGKALAPVKGVPMIVRCAQMHKAQI